MTQFIYFSLLLLLSWNTFASAETIDCAVPNTEIITIICNDIGLNKLNERVDHMYQKNKANKSPTEQQTLKKSQEIWLDSLIQICKDKHCLKQAYEQRLQILSKKTWLFKSNIHPNLASYQFKLTGNVDEETAHIQSIIIENTKTDVQQYLFIRDVSDMLQETDTLWLDRGEGFKIEDVNFDGYKDIRLMEFLPAGANVPYLYWLYDPKQHKFVFNRAFSELAHITLDQERKQLISQYRISAVEHSTDYYAVDQYQLTLVYQELVKYVENADGKFELMSLIKQRVDGKLKTMIQEPVE